MTALDWLGQPATTFNGTVNLSGLIPGGTSEITIGTGTGTWNYPMSTYYHDARAQVIYLTSEIGEAKELDSLSLYVSTIPGQAMNSWTIRMKHTALNAFAAASWEESGWTTVYQNNQTISTTGWIIFPFSTPFSYDGVNNLMIDFSFNNTSYTSDGLCQYSTPGGNRSVYYRTDSGYGDPLTWSGTTPTASLTANVPNIKLGGVNYTPVSITPTLSGSFTNGVWTGTITVLETAEGLLLRADDGNDKTGDSNLFNVIPLTPTVTVWPTASAITYGQSLSASTLSGGAASVPGSFAFTTPGLTPNAGTAGQSVTFTPTDTSNYSTVIGTVNVTVNKATPVVTAWPAASAITHGQSLTASTLTGGTASVPGAFGFTNPSLIPGVGTADQSVTFTPADTGNYNTVEGPVSVTVNPITHTLTYLAGENGSIDGATPQTVNDGADGSEVEAMPNVGYHFVNWSDGSTENPRIDENVTANITVTASFAADTYTVAFDATGGNTPVPESKAVTYNAPYGPLATTARTCYGFNGWFTAPDSGSLITEATIVSIASSHTLYAQWTANTYTVQYVADPSSGGSLSGNTTIAHAGATGDSVVVQVTPNTGWSVGDVDATNGVIAFTSGNEYLLSGVTDNTTVTAHFVEDTVEIHTWVYLEGAAMDQGGAVVYSVPMHATLNDLRILPGQTLEDPFLGIVYSPPGQPYSAAPWFYTGTEGAAFDSGGDPLNGDAGYPPTVVDWVLVSLRTTVDGGPVWQAAALLHNDGAVEFVDGSLPCCGADPAGPFYLVIEHYNHLIVMSHEPVPVVDHTLTYDFRSQQSYIDDPFGFGWVGQKEILPGVYALYGGNGDQASGEYTDTDITADDQGFWMQQNGIYGLYKFGDYIMNGDVNSDDVILWGLNNSKTTSVPRN